MVFDPPYVHYDTRNKERNEDYRRLTYVKRKLEEYLKTIDKESREKIYIDLATGSSTKHYFDINAYNEEQDPEFSVPTETRQVELPAIPVLAKHDGGIDPIQKYSFTLKSI